MSSIAAGADALFSLASSQAAQLSGLSSGALSRGIEAYTNKDYERAVTEFKRSIGLDPYSSNSLNAYDFMAQAYLKMDRPEDAESTYRQAIRLSPQSDSMRLKLANLYYSQNRYGEAEKEYAEAVRINPSEQNIYSLGQNYLSTNRIDEAEAQFKRILSLNSGNYGAIYSLGQIDRKRGNYDEAISKFRQAIELKKDFAFAYSDLGMTYADSGKTDKAEEQAQILDTMDQGLASDLRTYMYSVEKPGINFATTYAKPVMTNGPGTLVSSFDASLAAPGASQTFTLDVFFDKMMDRASVENIANWRIGRSTGPEQGGAYNWGGPISSTEVNLPPLPLNVYYDETDFSARVTFSVRQNSSGDGTIDPSHIVFGFYGKDAFGNTMNPAKDEYVGLSIIV